jgi:hypothetical protein
MTQAVVWRILGNEMPPRDVEGGRMAVLRKILDDEVVLKGAQRMWLLNRILDDEYRTRTASLLSDYEQPYVVIPFDKSLKPTVSAMRGPGVAINTARNTAINLGHAIAPWSVVLDGDCFFEDESDWEEVSCAMEARQTDYISIPHVRSGCTKLGEPMLAFHRNSKLRFDESLLFGDLDKLELCFRLGHDTTPRSGHLKLESGATTKVVGKVVHYPTGPVEVEMQLEVREPARLVSFQGLADRLKAIQDKR